MKLTQFILLLLFISSISFQSCSQKGEISNINLSGEWQFQMDIQDVGETEKWFSKNLDEVLQLPGSMVENGKGNKITLETKWTGVVKNTEWF